MKNSQLLKLKLKEILTRRNSEPEFMVPTSAFYVSFRRWQNHAFECNEAFLIYTIHSTQYIILLHGQM